MIFKSLATLFLLLLPSLSPEPSQRAVFFSQNVPSAVTHSCPFTDSFPGSTVPLTGSWTTVSSGFGGSGVINQSTGFARVATAGTLAVSLVTGGGCTFPADQSAQVVVNEVDGKVMPLVRATSSGNGYGAYVQASGSVLILRMDGGSGTVIASNTCSSVSGNTYKISITGSAITVFQNGTSCASATDSTYATGVPALFIDNSGSTDATRTQALSFQAD